MLHIIRPADRDPGTAQTAGMRREAAVSTALTGSKGLWMGFVTNAPGAKSDVHHHGASESGIYVIEGRVRFRWGDSLEHQADATPGDFIFVPPFEVHSEENLDEAAPARLVVARNTMEAIVVNVPDPRG
jgi:uncharacterized RmlC-like cupin family protein